MVWSIYAFVIFLAVAEFFDKISNVYFASNILLLLSACLYIPITVSIRRFNFLPSSKLNSPERYVLWQLVSIIILKFSYPVIVLTILDVDEEAIILCRSVDGFLIPLTVQISYFGSNRRNMKKLISTFKFWNYCRKKTAVVSMDNSINPSTI
uniref:G_PROTEIN_RECEP_F1_2 domain-containing protein n=1 Tax=Caenorhabditis tropicalis TaxID=1561998 RepID=A0A1I7TH48_9PELO